jgi:hypothetical protein
VWPLAARAQQGDRVRRIGVLHVYDENDPEGQRRVSAFTQALTRPERRRRSADRGAIEGRTCVHTINYARHEYKSRPKPAGTKVS